MEVVGYITDDTYVGVDAVIMVRGCVLQHGVRLCIHDRHKHGKVTMGLQTGHAIGEGNGELLQL